MSGQSLSQNQAEYSVSPILSMAPEDILARARLRAGKQDLLCAGAVTPEETWALFQADIAIIVDVRTLEERKFVGYVPDSIIVPWMCGNTMAKNPGFVPEMEKQLSKDAVLLLICRSGKRSAGAAETLTRAGFKNAFNVMEGFEGDLNGEMQRGKINGWRFKQLPWVQE